jgi:hypothetical protein
VEPPFKPSFGSSGFEHKIEENLKRRKLNTENSETAHYMGENLKSRNIIQVPLYKCCGFPCGDCSDSSIPCCDVGRQIFQMNMVSPKQWYLPTTLQSTTI